MSVHSNNVCVVFVLLDIFKNANSNGMIFFPKNDGTPVNGMSTY